jgi:putative transposase
MSADWCADILQETIQKYGVPEIFTDQGSQYTSEVHTNVLLNNGIKFLWTVKDELLTTFYERLWRTVKYENVYLQAYTDGISLTET